MATSADNRDTTLVIIALNLICNQLLRKFSQVPLQRWGTSWHCSQWLLGRSVQENMFDFSILMLPPTNNPACLPAITTLACIWAECQRGWALLLHPLVVWQMKPRHFYKRLASCLAMKWDSSAAVWPCLFSAQPSNALGVLDWAVAMPLLTLPSLNFNVSKLLAISLIWTQYSVHTLSYFLYQTCSCKSHVYTLVRKKMVAELSRK